MLVCVGASVRVCVSNSKHWFTTFFLQPLPYAIGSTKLSAHEQFFVGAQTVVSLL